MNEINNNMENKPTAGGILALILLLAIIVVFILKFFIILIVLGAIFIIGFVARVFLSSKEAIKNKSSKTGKQPDGSIVVDYKVEEDK